ncbi:hypothetical protein NM688_g7706 [Phlebia brevispora]|uniref:Uncharacterized protein n=1 Tax=Phlebia brevispora TaxID=194682 RepID=A0ACC1S2I9_9APHY|nr:hypothetical protein NM688_g7706 [Phlebia brevispora]
MSTKAPWLCPPEVTKTNVPFLKSVLTQESTGQTIDVVACSEFKEHTTLISHVEADPSHKLRLFLTGTYQPIIFSVGKDARLYCIQHVTGDAWKPFDITPHLSNSAITAFEAFQRSDGLLTVAASVASGNEDSRLFYADPFSIADDSFDVSNINFAEVERPESIGAILITSISMAAKDISTPDNYVLIGTHSTSTKIGNDYLINITPHLSWVTLSLFSSAAEAVKVVAATLREPYNACTAVLSKSAGQEDASSCDQLRCISLDPGESYNQEVHLGHIGGAAYDVAVTTTPAGLSDIYVAGVKGIGYYTGYDPSGNPTVIMGDMSFKQIIASEKAGAISGGERISEGSANMYPGGDGTGYWKKSPTFTTTAVPIRADVGFVSTQHNPSLNTTEVVYINTSSQQVHHLVRDPSSMWSGTVLHVKWKDTTVSYYAFETRLRLQGSSGTAVGAGYPLQLSSEQITYALVNDKSYRLSPSFTEIETDGSGCINVIIAADASISAPVLTFRLEGLGHSQDVPVDPRRRIALKWQYMPSGSEIKHATSTTGKPIFPNTTIPDETFNALAEMLQLVLKQDKIKNSAALSLKPSSALYSQGSFTDHIVSFGVWDWVKDAVEDVGKFFGDVVESVGNFLEKAGEVVKKVVKTGVAIFKGVINFVANIAGKVIRWALNTIGSVIRGAITVLKDVLGLDLTRLMAMFGWMLDYDNILRGKVRSSLHGVECSAVKDFFKGIKKAAAPYIKDQRSSDENNLINWSDLAALFDKTPLGYVMKLIVDNPVVNTIKNFLSKCIDIISSLVDEVIHLPGLDNLQKLTSRIVDIVMRLLTSEAVIFSDYIKDMLTKFAEVVTGARSFGEIITAILSDTFWTIIDALQEFAEALFEIISDIVDCVITMITGVIDIPWASSFWEGYTTLPFSLLNVMTLNLAHILYLITMESVEKLPFDVMPRWDLLIPEAKPISFSLRSDAVGGSSRGSVPQAAMALQAEASGELETDHWTSARIRDILCSFGVGVPIAAATAMDLFFAPSAPEGTGLESIPLRDIGGGEAQPAPTTGRRAPTVIGVQCFKWTKIAFVGVSLVVELGWMYAVNGDALEGRKARNLSLICQSLAVVLKGVDLAVSVNGGYWVSSFCPPLGNWISNLSNLIAAIEKMTEGKNIPTTYATLVAAEAGMASAVCDAATVWAGKTKQAELVPITVLSSVSCCAAQLNIGVGLLILN